MVSEKGQEPSPTSTTVEEHHSENEPLSVSDKNDYPHGWTLFCLTVALASGTLMIALDNVSLYHLLTLMVLIQDDIPFVYLNSC